MRIPPLGILVAVVVVLSPNIARSQGQPQSTPPQISYAEFITLDYAARRQRFAEDNRQALNDVLGQLRGEVTRSETVVFLGDYIDRGPDSKGCIDAILEFQLRSPPRWSAYAETMRTGSFRRVATTAAIHGFLGWRPSTRFGAIQWTLR